MANRVGPYNVTLQNPDAYSKNQAYQGNLQKQIEDMKKWLAKGELTKEDLLSVKSLLSSVPGYSRYNDELGAVRRQLNDKFNEGQAYNSPKQVQARSVQTDYATAKQANEDRYQDILGQYQGMEQNMAERNPAADYQEAVAMANKNYNTGMGFLNNAGVQEGSDIRQSGHNRQQQFMSDAISRGVAVPGLVTSMQRGIDRDTTANLGRMNDRLNTQRLNAHTSLSGVQQNLATEQARNKGQSYQDLINLKNKRLGFMERKTDGYPNVNAIAQYNAR